MPSNIETILAKISKTVEAGFAAVAEDLSDIKSVMATKDDLRVIVREELRDLQSELTALRTQLYELSERADNSTGYRKEIDYALERIAAVERHVGLKQ